VSTIAAGAWYQDGKYVKHVTKQVVTSYQPATDENYVHGFPTYAKTSMLPEAKVYFGREAERYFVSRKVTDSQGSRCYCPVEPK